MIDIKYNLATCEININTHGNKDVVMLVKRIPGKEYHTDKYWRIPLVNGTPIKEHIKIFIEEVENLGLEVDVTDSVWDALEFIENFQTRNFELSSANDYTESNRINNLFDRDLTGPQRAAVQYISQNAGGVILGDDDEHQPRTTALAAAEYMGDYPALVVCADREKWHWGGEFKRRTRRAVFVVNEEQIFITTARESATGVDQLAELAVVNFGNLAKYRVWLSTIEWKMIIIENGDNIQSTISDQATIILDLCRTIPHKLILSKTSILQPWRFLAQLEIIEHLQEFGGRKKFIENYTTQKKKDDPWQAYNVTDLEKSLRESCYIKHSEKEEVIK